MNHESFARIIQRNLRQGRFKDSITGRTRTILEDFLTRAEKYICIEEMMEMGINNKRKRDDDCNEDRRDEKKVIGILTPMLLTQISLL